jgi:hypothetical protein
METHLTKAVDGSRRRPGGAGTGATTGVSVRWSPTRIVMARRCQLALAVVVVLWSATTGGAPPADASRRGGTVRDESPPMQPTSPPVAVRYVPYAARGHALVPPTPTPTPLPAPTARPLPEGHGLQCVTPRTLEVCTWLSTGEVSGGDEISYGIRILEDGRPAEGVEITVRWSFPYPAVLQRCDAVTDRGGDAACGVIAPRLASGNAGHAQLSLNHHGWPYQRLITFTLR